MVGVEWHNFRLCCTVNSTRYVTCLRSEREPAMRLFHSISRFFGSLPVLVGLVAVLWSCDNTTEPPTPRERSFLSVIHAYDGVQSIDIELETYGEAKTVSEALLFTQSWPPQGYASLLSEAGETAGDTGVVIRLRDWRSKEQMAPDRVLRLFPGGKTTVGIIDSFGTPDLIQIRDEFDQPAPGRCNIRFMNLSNLYPAVDFESTNDSVFITRINYLLASKFEEQAADTYTFYLRHSFTREKLDSLTNVDLRPRKTYNIYLTQDGDSSKLGMIELE